MKCRRIRRTQSRIDHEAGIVGEIKGGRETRFWCRRKLNPTEILEPRKTWRRIVVKGRCRSSHKGSQSDGSAQIGRYGKHSSHMVIEDRRPETDRRTARIAEYGVQYS